MTTYKSSVKTVTTNLRIFSTKMNGAISLTNMDKQTQFHEKFVDS